MKSYEKIKLSVQLPHNSNAVMEGVPELREGAILEKCVKDTFILPFFCHIKLPGNFGYSKQKWN